MMAVLPICIEQCAALSEGLFFGSVGQKAEVTDAHEAIGQDVEQEAADKLFGLEGQRSFFDPRLCDLDSSE